MPSSLECPPFSQKSLHYDHEYHTSVPLQRLRASNLPATEEEIAHIQNIFLSNIHRDRVCLQARFDDLSRVVASMKEECDALMILENKCQNLISSRRALPHELWSNIFLHARSNDQDFDPLRPSGIIWRLSHVCQAWRDVALSLHSFWSRITINFHSNNILPYHELSEKTVQVLQLVFSHSNLLHINIHDAGTPSCADSIRDRILDVVMSQSHRWRSAYLVDSACTFTTQSFAALYAPLRGRLPQLSSLTANTDVEGANLQLFEDCPLLTKVALSYACCAVTLPVSQIVELQIGPSWYKGIMQASLMLIRQCPFLEVLRIFIEPPLVLDEKVQTVVTTSNVYKLETNSGPIIDNLVVPRLREAILSEPRQPYRTPADPFVHVLEPFRQLLRRSDCARTLTSLKIVDPSLRCASPQLGNCTLLSLLAETTRLSVLELSLCDKWDGYERRAQQMAHIAELMRALRISTEGNPNGMILLPCLSSMTIMANHVGQDEMPKLLADGTWTSFAAMLKARWEGAEGLGLSKLHTLHVALTDKAWGSSWQYTEDKRWIPAEERVILDGLLGAGMNLDIQLTLLYYDRGRWHHRVQHLLKVPRRASTIS